MTQLPLFDVPLPLFEGRGEKAPHTPDAIAVESAPPAVDTFDKIAAGKRLRFIGEEVFPACGIRWFSGYLAASPWLSKEQAYRALARGKRQPSLPWTIYWYKRGRSVVALSLVMQGSESLLTEEHMRDCAESIGTLAGVPSAAVLHWLLTGEVVS